MVVALAFRTLRIAIGNKLKQSSGMNVHVCGPRRARGTAFYLRATIGCDQEAKEMLPETKVALTTPNRHRTRWRSRRVHLALDASDLTRIESASLVIVELWEAVDGTEGSNGDALLTLAGTALMDVRRWRETDGDNTRTRWYDLQRVAAQKPPVDSAFEELEERSKDDALYICTTLVQAARIKETPTNAKEEMVGVPAAARKHQAPPASMPNNSVAADSTGLEGSDFRFVLPSRLVTRNRRFHSTRVGAIVFEVRSPSKQS